MQTIRITNKHIYEVPSRLIITEKINEKWWAYFKSNPDKKHDGINESEAIGNLITKEYLIIKVA